MYKSYKEGSSPLVSVDWLKKNLDTKDICLVDASYHLDGRKAKAEYEERHIPGAVFFDIDECANRTSEHNLPHMLPSPDAFQEYVSSRGISNSSHVVVYDNNKMFPVFSAQRVWWTFQVFGHKQVSVLDGGLQKWLAADGAVTGEATKVEKKTFKADFQKEMVKSFEDVKKNIQSSGFDLIDGRPPGRFQGTAAEPIPGVKPGHIPGAKNVPFMKLMDLESKSYKSPGELKKYFEEMSVDFSRPIAFTCGSALQATNLSFAAFICGHKDPAVYDGSWVEWFRRAPADLMVDVPSD